MPLVEVSMRHLDLLRCMPYCLPSVWKLSRNGSRSVCGTQTEVSSMMLQVWLVPPLVSSLESLFWSREVASWRRRLLIYLLSVRRTRQAKRGLRGHPWLNPSSWFIVAWLPWGS